MTVVQTNYENGIVDRILGVTEKWAIDRGVFRCILLVMKNMY